MERIRIFNFEINNSSSTQGWDRDYKTKEWFGNSQKRLTSYESIEKELNEFIKEKNLVDMKTNIIETHSHNNGGDNTIKIIYTIIYKD